MRNIKFRAYDNKNKQWLLGYNSETRHGFAIDGETILFGEWSNIIRSMGRGEFGGGGEDLIIQQYTGIKDKNEIEIYEGDIVEVMEDYSVPVIYSERYSSFEVATSGNSVGWWGSNRLEVVGNIFENAELLK